MYTCCTIVFISIIFFLTIAVNKWIWHILFIGNWACPTLLDSKGTQTGVGYHSKHLQAPAQYHPTLPYCTRHDNYCWRERPPTLIQQKLDIKSRTLTFLLLDLWPNLFLDLCLCIVSLPLLLGSKFSMIVCKMLTCANPIVNKVCL